MEQLKPKTVLWVDSLYPALIVNWLTSPGDTRHRITKFIAEGVIMETLLLNVNTSEGCFEIGVTISNPVFIEDAINKRKYEQELLSKICILSMLTRLRPTQKGYAQ